MEEKVLLVRFTRIKGIPKMFVEDRVYDFNEETFFKILDINQPKTVKFDEIFLVDDTYITLKKAIQINGAGLGKGMKFAKQGVKIGGFDISQFIGWDVKVLENAGGYIIKDFVNVK